MKKYLVIFLVSVLLLGLWGCGQKEYVGVYKGIYVEADGKIYPMEDYFSGENYLELKPRGKALMMTGTTEHKLTWKVEEGEIVFTEDGDPFYGYIKDGVISFDFMGWGMVMTFAMEGASIPETTMEDPLAYAEAVNAVLPYWNGDWYGWWYISQASGAYVNEQMQIRDCAARIQLDESARGSMKIWDLDHPYTAPLFEGILRVDPAVGMENVGIAMSGRGTFMGQPVESGDWLIDPSTAAYDNLLEIYGHYSDDAGEFFYTLYLRPWGQGWEDVLEAADPSKAPAELPLYYSLYLEALKTNTSPEDFFT